MLTGRAVIDFPVLRRRVGYVLQYCTRAIWPQSQVGIDEVINVRDPMHLGILNLARGGRGQSHVAPGLRCRERWTELCPGHVSLRSWRSGSVSNGLT